MARQALDESTPEWVKESDLILEGEPDPDASYLIRSISIETARQIGQAHTKRVPNRHTRAMEDKRDAAAIHDAMLDHALVDWKGVELNHKPLACDSIENKKRLPGFVLNAIVEWACAGHATKAEERAESFRTA